MVDRFVAGVDLRVAADRELSVREELEGRLRESIQKRVEEMEAKRLRDQKESDQRLTILVDGRTRELSDRLQKNSTDSHGRISGTVDPALVHFPVDGSKISEFGAFSTSSVRIVPSGSSVQPSSAFQSDFPSCGYCFHEWRPAL